MYSLSEEKSPRRWFDQWFTEREISLLTARGRWKTFKIKHINTEHGKWRSKIKRAYVVLQDGREFWIVFNSKQVHPELWVFMFNTHNVAKSYWIAPGEGGEK